MQYLLQFYLPGNLLKEVEQKIQEFIEFQFYTLKPRIYMLCISDGR